MPRFLCAPLFVILFVTSCANRPHAWQIRDRMLLPPGKPRPIVLKAAQNCPSTDAIPARRSGSRVILSVNSETLGKQPPGWLAGWAADAEMGGCTKTGEGPALAERLLESAPQNLAAGYRLMHADH